MSLIIVRFAGAIVILHMSDNFVRLDVSEISAGLSRSYKEFLDCFFSDISEEARRRLVPVDARWEEDRNEFFYYSFGCVVLSEGEEVIGKLLLDCQQEPSLRKGYLRSIVIEGEDFGYYFTRYFGCIDDAVMVLDMLHKGEREEARKFVGGLPDTAAEWAFREERRGR